MKSSFETSSSFRSPLRRIGLFGIADTFLPECVHMKPQFGLPIYHPDHMGPVSRVRKNLAETIVCVLEKLGQVSAFCTLRIQGAEGVRSCI